MTAERQNAEERNVAAMILQAASMSFLGLGVTALLSVIYASNISGAALDIAAIVKAAREIKPDLYIIVDSVQHAPHGVIDVDALDLDGVDFAPYKFFGVRGSGIGYASDRVSALPHPVLLGKNTETRSLGSPAPAHFAVITEIVDYVFSKT